MLALVSAAAADDFAGAQCASSEGRCADDVSILTKAPKDSELIKAAVAVAYSDRRIGYRPMKQYRLALQDLGYAIELNADHALGRASTAASSLIASQMD